MEHTENPDSGFPQGATLSDFRAIVREELRAERRREAAPEPLLTKADAAEVLGVSERTVDTLVASGQLASVKVARCRRIPPQALHAYVRQQAEEGSDR